MAVLAAAVVMAGCGGDEIPRAVEKHPVERTARPSPATATPSAPAKPAPEVPAEARRQSAALPLDQRVGQLFVVGFDGVDFTAPVFEELAGHGWGGIVITPENAIDPSAMAAEAVVRAGNAGRVAPLVAAEEAAPGVTLTLGPDVDVPLAGGPDPKQAARIARQALRADVTPALGHFPGQGAASQDPLDGPAQVGLSPDDLRDRDLVPFAAVASKAPVFVVSSASYLTYDPVTPAAHLPAIVHDLLREELQFGGVAMSDDLGGLEAATGSGPGAAAVDAIAAGIDLVYVPDPEAARRGVRRGAGGGAQRQARRRARARRRGARAGAQGV